MQEYQVTHFCQSCGMDMSGDVPGTERDGSKSDDYCAYCYENGEFKDDYTLEQMIDICARAMNEYNPEMSFDEAKVAIGRFLPRLKRWSTLQ